MQLTVTNDDLMKEPLHLTTKTAAELQFVHNLAALLIKMRATNNKGHAAARQIMI